MARGVLFLFAVLCLASCSQAGHDVFPAWKKGEMEIHHIYTGRGESSFIIFPDGTTMLIDAGDYDPVDYQKMTRILPDSSRRSGEWIARYVSRVNGGHDKVDYLMISHFHSDHTGGVGNDVPMTCGRGTDYKLTGIAEVGEYLRFGTVLDRGYPDYAYPVDVTDADFDNYRAFVSWHTVRNGMRQEKFEVGRLNQIHMLNDRVRYGRLVSVRNLAANGEVWTGEGENTMRCYDLNPVNLVDSLQNENTKSLAVRIDYGRFSYYTGGDVSSWVYDGQGHELNVEELVGEVCGRVDVCKANHHAWKDAMCEGFVNHVKASQYIIPVWEDEHIQPDVMKRLSGDVDDRSVPRIFPTNMPPHLRQRYGAEDWMGQVCRYDGHVVIKVCDGGQEYSIYVLSAESEDNRVKGVYGPFKSN